MGIAKGMSERRNDFWGLPWTRPLQQQVEKGAGTERFIRGDVWGGISGSGQDTPRRRPGLG